jgi:hypothetical protein
VTKSVVIFLAKKSSLHHLWSDLLTRESSLHHLWSDLCKYKQKIIKREMFFLYRFYVQRFSVEILTDFIPTQKPSGQGMLLTAQLHPLQRLRMNGLHLHSPHKPSRPAE